MATYTQADRPFAVTTPLGTDVLLLESFSGQEQLSSLFSFRLDLLAESGKLDQVKFGGIMGQSVTIAIRKANGELRYLNGIVARFGQGQQVYGPTGGVEFVRFHAEVVPKFWLWQRRVRSRIFQQMSVPEILKSVLAELDCSFEIQGTFHPRDYCVQYRESDFAFASRLMEEEGIYYYFVHDQGSHKMIVANTPSSHRSVVPAAAKYERIMGGNRVDDRVYSWEKMQEIRAVKHTLWDHCFELPNHHLEATTNIQQSATLGTEEHKLGDGSNSSLEIYDYPGGYAQRFDGIDPGGGERASDIQKIFEDNTRTVGIRMQQEAVQVLTTRGTGVCAHFSAGHQFELTGHHNGNGKYVLTKVIHRGTQSGLFISGSGEFSYQNEFEAIPATVPFRPQRTTPKAVILGTHAATVVGPPGEEIFTDKYGRVKVQFRWDREGKQDANSSCWVRVATLWAGTQWGMIHLPRIGQEVIVAFEEADPDRPIIIGSVYNAATMPPYTLPDHRTKSGIKSRSSLNGSEDNFNEIRFEDKAGSEEIYIHAERDFLRIVENNDTLKIGHVKKDKGDQSIEIFNNRSVSIGAGQSESESGNDTLDIYNSQIITIGSGKNPERENSQKVTIFNNRTVTLETGTDELTVSKGDIRTKVSKGSMQTDVAEEIVFVTGKSSLVMKKDGTIKLIGSQVTVEGSSSLVLKSGTSSVELSPAGIEISGTKTSLEGKAAADVSGGIVKVQANGICTIGGALTKIG